MGMGKTEPGWGDFWVTEPTTVCDIIRTFSYIDHDTPAMRMIALLAFNYGYRGHYDEDGNWYTNCPNRGIDNYSDHYKEDEEVSLHQRWWILKLNVGDAYWDYRGLCPELAQQLQDIKAVLETEEEAGLWRS